MNRLRVRNLGRCTGLFAILALLAFPSCGSDSGGGSEVVVGRAISGVISLPPNVAGSAAGAEVSLTSLSDGADLGTTRTDDDGNFEFPPVEGRDGEVLVPIASIVDALTGVESAIGGLVPPPAGAGANGRAEFNQSKMLTGETQIACIAGFQIADIEGTPDGVTASRIDNLEAGAERFVASTDFADGESVADAAAATRLITNEGNDAPVEAGLIVTLVWDGEQDLDLWVRDPFGERVWWQNTVSQSGGSLDVDDINGFGPENIIWPAGGAPRGEYVVQVDYFRGSGPANYMVTVQGDGPTRTFNGTIDGGTDLVDRFTL